MSKLKIVKLLFWFVSMLHIIGLTIENEQLRFATKPFLILTLIGFYIVSVKQKNKLYVLALVFSFLGDVLLMGSGEIYFILGLVSFLLAHLTFIKIISSNLSKVDFNSVLKSVVPFGIFLMVLLLVLLPHLNELKIPVIIYGTIISIFGIVSSLWYLQQGDRKSLLMLFGAIVFAISDSILALNKFYYSTHIFEVSVMVTYILAQYLIFKSMILEKKN